MRDRLVRYLVLSVLVAGLFAGIASQGMHTNAAEAGGFTASAVEIGKTGFTGQYNLSEPPGNPPVGCTGYGAVVAIGSPGYVYVGANNVYLNAQKANVTEVLYQRMADGSYSKLWDGAFTTIDLNHYYPVTAYVGTTWWTQLPIGPDYVLGVRIRWLRAADLVELGSVQAVYTSYSRKIDGTVLSNSSVCGGLRSPSVVANTTTGIVGSTNSFTLQYFPTNTSVPITWDGKQIGSAWIGSGSFSSGSFKIPASPMGSHTVQWKYGHWSTKVTYTVKPRVKVSPSTNVPRGFSVNVSLRGYAAHETVAIRWKKGTSFVNIATVTTSSTGSANINVKVPTWVPNGSTAVRGDGASGHAQTNAVSVLGGTPLSSASVRTPTPTATAESTPAPQATKTPATVDATPTSPIETATPTAETPVVDETTTPKPSPSVTAEPTDTPAPTEEASSPTPTETPTLEATATP